MRQVNSRHIVIAGAARSGVAAARLLKRRGAIPFVTDAGTIPDAIQELLKNEGIGFEQNMHSDASLGGDFLVLSPGIPDSSPIVRGYTDQGKEVFSEVEVASWFCRSPILAVTGTNGKTSVASWMAHTWKIAGKDHILAGNIGLAFSDFVDDTSPQKDVLLEISSFQLDHIDSFRPYASIILNISPDHLDRYQNDVNLYAASKLNITKNQSATDRFIYNFEDPILSGHAKKLAGKENAPQLLAFSGSGEVACGAFVRNGNLILKTNDNEEQLMQISEIGLKGLHNLQNGMATALAARASEIKNEFIRESLKSFEGVAHRLEFVRKYEGVSFVNDSKATNVNSVWYALNSFNMPVVLILGGRDKGNDYSYLEKQIREKVHTIVAIGEARQAIRQQLESVVPHLIEADSMKDAVKKARKAAKRGETVLLSPACSSFDMFDNFEHRGNEFKQAVLDI
ncbi:MAG: UDP-N-acetylmuramoyl-L-alanine--D-glutamate ligase [Balneolaceae bacterium]|nr:MAG: UDP-N-acetylmuramoyl-L-alanine--D-glutamate ligase [Balneolaceae bacterium]